jgi:hypothetical protein
MHTMLESESRPGLQQFGMRAGVVAVAAVVVNLVVTGLAALIAGPTLQIPDGPGSDVTRDLGAGEVIISTIVGTILGVVGLLLARRLLGHRAETIFAVVATVFAILTIATSITSGIPASSKLTLALLHVTSAAVIIPGLLTSRTSSSQT